MPRRRAPQPPTHPRYEILRELGNGASGAVFHARDRLEAGQEVALKVCHGEIAPELVLGEFRILRALRHPSIPRAFDFGRLPGDRRTFFSLEYFSGSTLEDEGDRLRAIVARDGDEELLQLFLRIASALEYLHGKGLLHLDLKPANIVVAGDLPKLIDFGLFENVHQPKTRRRRGTALYTAPEVFDGEQVDARTDLYSLGVTMYRTWTGRYPITGRSLDEIASRHRTQTPQTPTEMSEPLARIVLKLLAKSPRHRFHTASDVRAALESLSTVKPAAPARLSTETPIDLSFVGRRRELDTFFAWTRTVEGGGAAKLLWVEGDPGIGKSRFLEACGTELLGLGIGVIRVRGYSGGGDDIMRQLVEQLVTLRPPSDEERAAAAFVLTFLDLERDEESLRDIAQLELEQIHTRAVDQIVALLCRQAEPLVVLVDDFHFANPLLRALVERLQRVDLELGAPRGIVFTYRPESDSFITTLRQRDGSATSPHIRLGPLERSEVQAALLDLDASLSEEDRARWARISGGNPGVLLQLLGHGAAGGTTAENERIEEGRGAADLQTLLRERFSQVRGEPRRLALYLACLGRAADATFLARVLGAEHSAVTGWLRALQRHGVLERHQRAWLLDQDLLDPQSLEAYGEDAVEEAHRVLAQHLPSEGRPEYETALHLFRGGEPAAGLEIALRIGDELRALGQFEKAIELYTTALQYATGSADRRQLLEGLGDHQERSGRFDQSFQSFRAILELDPAAEDRVRILRKIGGIEQRMGDNEAALKTFRNALDAFEATDNFSEHLHVLNELAALELFRGEYPRSMTYANRGLEMLASPASSVLDDHERALHALNLHSVSGHILLRQFEYEQAADQLRRSLESGQAASSLWGAALILNNLGIAYHQSNQLHEALGVYEQASQLARKTGDETAMFSVQCNVAGIHARLGSLKAATEILRSIERMPHPGRSKRARLFLLHTRGLIARLLLHDAAEIWNRGIELARELPDPLVAVYEQLYLVENEIDQGRWAEARRGLAELREVFPEDGRLRRSVDLREAHLEALCGHRERAATLLADREVVQRLLSGRGASYAELWDGVRAALALVELHELYEARSLLTEIESAFLKSAQPIAVLECQLLLCEIAVRGGNVGEARTRLSNARGSYESLEGAEDFRDAALRLPFLEARLILQEGDASARGTAQELLETVAHRPGAATLEIGWLVSLLAVECGMEEVPARLREHKERFLRQLTLADRRAYEPRDHGERLGLSLTQERDGGMGVAGRCLSALAQLRVARDVEAALGIVAEACGAERAAVFHAELEVPVAALGYEGHGDVLVARKRRQALRAADGASGKVLYARLCGQNEGTAVLAVEFEHAVAGSALEPLTTFLELARPALGGLVPEHFEPSSKALGDSTETRSLFGDSKLTSVAPSMNELITLIERTRDSALPVLLTGESGVGKDHVARWIHARGPQQGSVFIGQDCGAIPPELLEAEFFGYQAGAFTGAERNRDGLLQAADGGTFYLDNVDCLPLEVQSKLLRVIQNGEFRPLGSSETRTVKIRLMASTQQDLRDLADRGAFRSDLYFRLAGICLSIPPLRQRAEDIPHLVRSFQRQNQGLGLRLTDGAIETLKAHSWPGNIRELEAVVRRLSVTAEGTIDEGDIRRILGAEVQPPGFPRWVFDGRSYDEVLREVKREYLLYLFDRFDGDLDLMASEMQTTKRNVYLRFSQVGLKPTELRDAGSRGDGAG